MMGIAEVIPGVSGGTLALISGIYGRLVDAIKSANLPALKSLLRFRLGEVFRQVHWIFLLLVFSGQGLGIVLCTKIIPLPDLLRSHPAPVLGLFFGLIVGSILLLGRDAGRPGGLGIVAYLVGGAVGWVVVTGVPAETPTDLWFIFLCGIIAICAWILPGISGSYTLLLLKKYDYIWGSIGAALGALGKGDFAGLGEALKILLPFALGALAGISLFSRLLSWVLARYQNLTMMAMNGLLIVSLYAIFPWQDAKYEMHRGKEKLIGTVPRLPSGEELARWEGVLACVLPIVGFVLVLMVDRMARAKKPESAAGPAV
ncbi:MAG: DUF368 domain-containing protein [Planctomycetota bacterium]|nr:DUF368 domain-containing protein [Planctomycetota bacterium]